MKHQFINVILLAAISSAIFSGCKSHKTAATITTPIQEQKVQAAPEESKPSATEAEEEAKLAALKESTYKGRLGQYFDAITNATSVNSANSSIDEAMYLFSSPQTPVLIVISNENGQKDFDRPTSIKDYLNYLKDQKKNSNMISQLKLDQFGKIVEVELTKNNQIK